MEQLNLFSGTEQNHSLPPELLDYLPGLFNEAESDYLMQKFIKEMPWQQKSVLMYGKEVVTPDLPFGMATRKPTILFQEVNRARCFGQRNC
jgi:hypothetical protein